MQEAANHDGADLWETTIFRRHVLGGKQRAWSLSPTGKSREGCYKTLRGVYRSFTQDWPLIGNSPKSGAKTLLSSTLTPHPPVVGHTSYMPADVPPMKQAARMARPARRGAASVSPLIIRSFFHQPHRCCFFYTDPIFVCGAGSSFVLCHRVLAHNDTDI